MATEAEEVQRLIRTAELSLAPASVPPHRALDVFTRSDRSQPDGTAFCDTFWTRPGHLACCAIRIGGGPAGRLGAHAFKALLRAALRHHPADRALELGLQAMGAYGPALRVDAAVAVIATRDGAATVGTQGSGAASRLAVDGPAPVAAGARVRLARGDALRLSAGAANLAWPPASAPTASADLLQALVAGAPGSAAAAIVLKDFADGEAGTFVLPNDVEAISPLLGEIGAYLARRGVGTGAWGLLEVALDELLTNVVLYAYRDGGVHEVLIEARAEGDALRVEISDDGIPFDPTAVPPPDLGAGLDDRPVGGLGLHLARTAFDAIGYRRDRGWNVVRLVKSLAGAPR